jgi:hypothetical protein
MSHTRADGRSSMCSLSRRTVVVVSSRIRRSIGPQTVSGPIAAAHCGTSSPAFDKPATLVTKSGGEYPHFRGRVHRGADAPGSPRTRSRRADNSGKLRCIPAKHGLMPSAGRMFAARRGGRLRSALRGYGAPPRMRSVPACGHCRRRRQARTRARSRLAVYRSWLARTPPPQGSPNQDVPGAPKCPRGGPFASVSPRFGPGAARQRLQVQSDRLERRDRKTDMRRRAAPSEAVDGLFSIPPPTSARPAFRRDRLSIRLRESTKTA